MPLAMSRREETEAKKPNATEERGDTDLLSLLNTEYTQTILELIRAEPRTAREIVEGCGASKPTVYRRLNDLEDAGLVESGTALAVDGHHRRTFVSTLRSISVDVSDDGVAVTVTKSNSTRLSSQNGQVSAGD